MKEQLASAARSTFPSKIGIPALGGVLSGFLAAARLIGFTEILKGILAIVSRQQTWVIILMPLVGLSL